MKNQYFGDINDYRKYGILRALGGYPLNVVMSWMLTPNDGRSDGRFTSYLSEPERWEFLEPELFQFLRKSVVVRSHREVAALVKSELIPSAQYVNVLLDGSAQAREAWLSETARLAGPGTLVFFDPDNGLEVKSVGKRSKEASKYLYWDEVKAVWSKGASLIVYQHFIRENRETFLARLAGEFRKRLGARNVVVARTSNVAFFLLPQQSHSEILMQRARAAGKRWKEQIRIQQL
ncbi:MAG TPA: hypothetical protein VMH23_19485 [Bacteroidota bacterium]|nr:hypothetical protein [Bacteroidota bacterium]